MTRRVKTERAQRLGTLVASGMIVGESLFGVLNAGLIVGFNRDAPLAVVAERLSLWPTRSAPWCSSALIVFLYAWMLRKARAMRTA